MRKWVWCEQDEQGYVTRILRDNKEAYRWNAVVFYDWFYDEAVLSIRHRLWLRCKGECELCAVPVTEDSGHMHEQKHRGKGGEISLANSVFICSTCHRRAHADRNPHFSKKT